MASTMTHCWEFFSLLMNSFFFLSPRWNSRCSTSPFRRSRVVRADSPHRSSCSLLQRIPIGWRCAFPPFFKGLYNFPFPLGFSGSFVSQVLESSVLILLLKIPPWGTMSGTFSFLDQSLPAACMWVKISSWKWLAISSIRSLEIFTWSWILNAFIIANHQVSPPWEAIRIIYLTYLLLVCEFRDIEVACCIAHLK